MLYGGFNIAELPLVAQGPDNPRNSEGGPSVRRRRPGQRSEGSRQPGPWPARDESSHGLRK